MFVSTPETSDNVMTVTMMEMEMLGSDYGWLGEVDIEDREPQAGMVAGLGVWFFFTRLMSTDRAGRVRGYLGDLT